MNSAVPVSIVLPTYNRSWGLRRAIASVLSQTFQSFELVIADDASSDNTAEVIQTFSDPRVVYHRNVSNVGIPANWTVGLRLARGEYVCFLMDDDYYDSSFLARRLRAASTSGATAVFGAYRRRSEGTSRSELFRGEGLMAGRLTSDEYFEAALRGLIFIGTALYRTELVRAVWDNIQQYHYVIDHALNLQLANSPNATAFYFDEPDFTMSCHSAQISNCQGPNVYKQASELLRDLLASAVTSERRWRIRRELSHWHLVWARRAREAGEFALSLQRLCLSLSSMPTNMGAWRQCASQLFRY